MLDVPATWFCVIPTGLPPVALIARGVCGVDAPMPTNPVKPSIISMRCSAPRAPR